MPFPFSRLDRPRQLPMRGLECWQEYTHFTRRLPIVEDKFETR